MAGAMLTAPLLAQGAMGAALGGQALGTVAGYFGGETQKAAALTAGQASNAADIYQAQQLEQNAGGAIASGQRQSFDTLLKTNAAISTARARAAGGGVATTVGSPATDVGQIARRGSYLAGMDLWRGQNQATGNINQAQGLRYSGQAALMGAQYGAQGAGLSALGTVAGGAGSLVSTFGRFAYPQVFGYGGARF